VSFEPSELKDKMTADVEAGKKAFRDAMEKAQSQIDAAIAKIHTLRAELKTQADEARARTMARIDELTNSLDAARKAQQAQIEARLKELHPNIESIGAEVKHATAEEKVALAKAKFVLEEYDFARRALTASLDAELAEWKARIGAALDTAAEKKVAAKAAVQAKIANLHAKHEAAQKKLRALKQANTAAFGELHRGVQTAIVEVKTALQHARADIAKAS